MTQLKLSKKSGAAGAVCSVAAIIAIVLNAGHVRTNEQGLNLIGNAESCRRDPYKCPADKWTDGVGNTHNVTPGVRKSDQQIAKEWEENILVAERCVNTYFRGKEMPTNSFSAMSSAAFNMGCGNLRFYWSKAQKKNVQTSINKYAQRADWVNMCHHLPDFVNAGGKRLNGLVTRRNAEMKLCLGGLK